MELPEYIKRQGFLPGMFDCHGGPSLQERS